MIARHGRADDFRRPDDAAGRHAGRRVADACTSKAVASGRSSYLMLVGSIGGFVSYIYALQHLPVATVSLYAYANPLIAVVLGALVLGEPFTARTVVSMAIVFAGMALVRTRKARRPSRLAGPACRRCVTCYSSSHDRLPPFRRCTANSAGWGFFLCTDKSVRTGRGGDYLALTLADATGELVARVFDNVDRLRDEFEAGEFVKAQGRASRVQRPDRSSSIENIRRVMAGPTRRIAVTAFARTLLVPSAPRPIDEMWRELQQVVAGVGNPHLDALLDADRRRARSGAEALAGRPRGPSRLSRRVPRAHPEDGRGRPHARRALRRQRGPGGRRRAAARHRQAPGAASTTPRRPTHATAT